MVLAALGITHTSFAQDTIYVDKLAQWTDKENAVECAVMTKTDKNQFKVEFYTLDGKPVTAFDPTDDLDRMEPVVTMLPGWNCDISHCTLYNELPDEAKGYIEFLEKQLVHVIQFVSTGAEREQYLLKGTWL